jgi:hypothetical protein
MMMNYMMMSMKRIYGFYELVQLLAKIMTSTGKIRKKSI